jgi:hypothetical protein
MFYLACLVPSVHCSIFLFSEFWVRARRAQGSERAPLGPISKKLWDISGAHQDPTGAQRKRLQNHHYFAPVELVRTQRPRGPTRAQRKRPQIHNYFAPGEFVGAQRPCGANQLQ